MVKIRIIDYVQHASGYDDGQKIYDLISPSIISGEHVEVSFDGISAVPSAFINAAFLQLLEKVSMEEVREFLQFTDSTKFINELIKLRFDFAVNNKN